MKITIFIKIIFFCLQSRYFYLIIILLSQPFNRSYSQVPIYRWQVYSNSLGHINALNKTNDGGYLISCDATIMQFVKFNADGSLDMGRSYDYQGPDYTTSTDVVHTIDSGFVIVGYEYYSPA